MCTRITEHLRRVSDVYLPTADDEAPAQCRKKSKGTWGKLTAADTTVVNQITWPHARIHTPSVKRDVYTELSSMAFVNGYLSVMATETGQVNVRMPSHLQEMMEDGRVYMRECACAYPSII